MSTLSQLRLYDAFDALIKCQGLQLPPPHCGQTGQLSGKCQIRPRLRFGWNNRLPRHHRSALQASPVASFPENYVQLVRTSRDATQAALADGHKLIEIEFPTYSLAAVAGDDDGAAEMSASLGFLRSFCQPFQQQADTTRIFFPDAKEMRVAKEGKALDPAAGSPELQPTFGQSNFKLDYLTDPNPLSDIGIVIGQPDVLDRIRESDQLYIVAYPYFNVSEMLAVARLYEKSAAASGKPIIVFNGELDRIRSKGYYPPLFYPKLTKLADTLLPLFESAYYLHNFKGVNGGSLFRVYPGPWQVLRRYRDGSMRTVHTQDTRPSLRDVALKILPKH